eukprot:TRINITY_DN814_c0_g1_i1.p1 TRINITY_DN814_c0_g1~~TRINITY_DN814_c0_g1_i1.p1  ORF type:complete len:105 (-),score=25.77 TRINITY_DN814_c0_g1_i1:92-406(-)
MAEKEGKTWQVTIRNSEEKNEKTIPVSEYDNILDVAEEQRINLPYNCRAGACSTCACKIISGQVEQMDQTYMDEKQVEAGYVLICVAQPRSDLVLETHKEEELF